METSQRTFRLAVLNLPVFQLVMYTAVVLIMWLGGNMVLNSGLQVGQLTGFLSYVLQVMNSMMLISNVFLLLTRSLASAPPHQRGAGREYCAGFAGGCGGGGARRQRGV